MSEKNRKMWYMVMLVATNLFLLILIGTAASPSAQALCLGCNGEKVAAVQRRLKEKGIYSGEINGGYDFATRKAVKAFQSKNGLKSSGEADYETVAALGVDTKGECFSLRTQLLARYLERHGGVNYYELLEAGEKLLSDAGCAPLGQYILSIDSDFYKNISDDEPSSEAYAAALHVIRFEKN